MAHSTAVLASLHSGACDVANRSSGAVLMKSAELIGSQFKSIQHPALNGTVPQTDRLLEN